MTDDDRAPQGAPRRMIPHEGTLVRPERHVLSREEPPSYAAADPALRQQLGALAARYCPAWLRGQVDDIAQAAWLRIASASVRHEGKRSPGASLLAKAAYCATIDEIRRRRRRHEVPLADEHRAADPDPHRALEARDTGRAIRECLARMLRDRRRAVTLRLLGHSVAEAARLLDWPAKRAENLVLRGLADLRRCLAGKGIVP